MRWAIKMKKTQRVPTEYVGRWYDMHREAFRIWESGSNNYEETEIVRILKGTYLITAFYETDRYIFMPIRQMVGLENFRNVPPPETYTGIYDKRTRHVLVTRELVNDIDGIKAAFRKGGNDVNGNCWTCCLWPYELMEDIDPSRPAHQPLMKLKEDDNPVYIKAYLKQ